MGSLWAWYLWDHHKPVVFFSPPGRRQKLVAKEESQIWEIVSQFVHLPRSSSWPSCFYPLSYLGRRGTQSLPGIERGISFTWISFLCFFSKKEEERGKARPGWLFNLPVLTWDLFCVVRAIRQLWCVTCLELCGTLPKRVLGVIISPFCWDCEREVFKDCFPVGNFFGETYLNCILN